MRKIMRDHNQLPDESLTIEVEIAFYHVPKVGMKLRMKFCIRNPCIIPPVMPFFFFFFSFYLSSSSINARRKIFSSTPSIQLHYRFSSFSDMNLFMFITSFNDIQSSTATLRCEKIVVDCVERSNDENENTLKRRMVSELEHDEAVLCKIAQYPFTSLVFLL